MEQTFRAGDRVECIVGYDDSSCGPYTGWKGTVREFIDGDPIVTWDGRGVRAYSKDRCARHRLRLIEAAPSLEARIAALEAEVKALKDGQGVQPAQQTYAFGDPVKVRVYGKWLKGFVISPHPGTDGDYRIAVLGCKMASYDERGDWGYFPAKDIRPCVK